jgi:CRP/FNR family cyclic AMP-dependent transcriptional regulator
MALSRDEKAELLRKVELFGGIDDESLAAIADRALEVSFPAGRWIVRQGEIGTGFFLLVAGRARVVRDDEVLAEIGPGDFFGELSLLDQQPRVAHVITEEDTDCLALASWDFDALLEAHPRIAVALLRGLARRARASTERSRH